MRIFVEAATGLPIILFSAAVVVVVCFWLLVAVGVVAMDGFDEDADLDAWGMGGVPVEVAVSLLTVLAWVFGVGAAALLAVLAPTGTGAWVLRLAVAVGAPLVAWRVTRLFVRRLRRFSSDERGPSRPTARDHAT
ncbi:hypothetical protein OOK58_09360 [Streptomyces sp. NBC_01728]|uniref:hypothetical protein n=1 Tax=unclassified Streptomyces TaxID=2593676 RepID=UPI0022556D05|nr:MULTISPECIES: hypothetical protein [unclassified Streptomyces]MCX4452322.1 hypothetical protein [Streptomyces sp. NBC_01719]MCX4491682.1 hypothetical protein [Streptomyces sp. NBC_01728]